MGSALGSTEGIACPMKARRAPELASGFMRRRLADMTNLAASSVLHLAGHLATEGEKMCLMENFNLARDRVEMGLLVDYV